MEKFYVCPVCNKPIAKKKDIQERIHNGTKYCGHCGKEIASTLAEALAEKD
jgi:transcription elongation factor Elf1